MAPFEKVCVGTATVSLLGLIGAILMLRVEAVSVGGLFVFGP